VRKGSAPELFTRPDASNAVQSSAPPAQRSASASATPVLRPMAIPALKGLSFLTGRSRSNPGTLRDSKPLSVRPTVPEAGDKKERRSVSTDVYSDEKPPENVTAPLTDVPATPAPTYVPLPVAASPISGGGMIDDAARARQGASASSRSTSPGPSLSEALFRARRPATPHTPGKGTRFKSSFTGVADHVLRLGEQHQQQVQAQTFGDLKDAPDNDGGPSSKATETPGGE
jgi:metal transporter CNNM